MNIAKRFIEYYSSEDFINNYAEYLLEDTQSAIDRIMTAVNGGSYDLIKYYASNLCDHAWHMKLKIDRLQAEEILEHIIDNIEDYTEQSSVYVGDCCIDYIHLGEQEEQLSDLYNHKTGKNYNINYLKRIFEKEGYSVSSNYAYYDLSYEGVGIFLVNNPKIPLLEKLYKEIE